MKVIAIVQARMGSTRLPNKVMSLIRGRPMIELLLSRLAKSTQIDQIIVATSVDPRNQPLRECVEKLGYHCFIGSELDVLERYYEAAKSLDADIVVRITGDCPVIDPVLVDECIERFKSSNVDYLSNTMPPTFPDGLDTEVFSFLALQTAAFEAKEAFDREHVTPYIRNSLLLRKSSLQYGKDLSNLRWTVDEFSDLEVIRNIFNFFEDDIYFSWTKILELQKNKPELFLKNLKLIRNEGADMGTGQKLWKRAKQVIPGGNMLLSKRAEMFLPDLWPAYFSKAKGCRVWDLDGNEFIDMSIMGIGTNTLGYGHPEVDDAVGCGDSGKYVNLELS